MLNGILLVGASDQLALGNFVFVLGSFVVLMYFIKKFAWGPVTKMMQERADKIANDLDTAETSRVEAQELASQRQSQLQAARGEANSIITDAKDAGAKQREQIITDATATADSLKTQAKVQIEQERTEAMQAVKNEVAEMSVSIAQKIIQKELKLDDQKALIDAYIEGLGDK
ncbi:MAG: F0F1 ATP synthase subunit B [Lactobacillaceae bacterium]|jgi:F-type H+-transporting ATPase subunit b|nr:F0F1 ATP synthase subunit B [Lactobacillaceae bacterium]